MEKLAQNRKPQALGLDWESGTHEIVRPATRPHRQRFAQRRARRRAPMFRAARLIGSGRGAVRVPVRRVSRQHTQYEVQLTM